MPLDFHPPRGLPNVLKDGVEIVPSARELNFEDTGVTVAPGGPGRANIDIPGGGGGGGTSDDVETMAFTFATPSPQVLTALASGDTFVAAEVRITAPFDDPAATVRVGTSADASHFLGVGDVDPTTPGGYLTQLVERQAAADFLLLSINPGASTQGAGLVLWRVKR